MPQVVQLNRDTGWISIASGMRLRAPGLTGSVVWRAPGERTQFVASTVLESTLPASLPDPIEQALKEAGLTDQGSLTISAGTSAPAGPSQLVLDRSIAQNQIEFAIYRDETGVISLHRPLPSPPPPSVTAMLAAPAPDRTSRSFHYVIPVRQATTPTGASPRIAMLGGIAGKIIRFVGRAVTGIAGDAVYAAAKLWEDNFRRPQGFHWGETLDQLLATTPVQLAPTDPNWSKLQGNNTLLFIHGTISSTVGGYLGLEQFPNQAASLYAKYENRAIGFNHHTLTKSVPQNAVDFYSGLPPGSHQFDVVSHSRGGLLARALKELTPVQLGQLVDPVWNPPPELNVQIGKVVLVGTPNVGTPLANPTDLPDAVSRLASIATALSQDLAAAGLGALFAIFGGIVEGGIGALPGLEDMNPGNPFLEQLNSASNSTSSYFGVQADFQPTGGLATAIESDGVDALFLGEANDLVVPTLGVSDVNGQTLPGVQVDAYPQSANVYHTDYFFQQPTWDSIVAFLP
jgi:pimeloyl-ACP methyl ester carboxylesterase